MKLNYTVDGPPDAPVLVLGSALGTTGAMWQPQMTALSQRLRVVRYDHRGHGRSPAPQGPYAIDELGRDVLELLDRLEAPRVHLAGLSFGGIVAMWLAANAPDRVDRLALMCTGAWLGPADAWTQRAETVRSQGMQAVAEIVLGRWFTPAFAQQHAGVIGWVRRMLTTMSPEGYAACCEAIGEADLTGALSTITASTLVIAAADDPSTPLPLLETIAAGITGSRLEIVADAAHLCNVQQPDEVNRLLLEFFCKPS